MLLLRCGDFVLHLHTLSRGFSDWLSGKPDEFTPRWASNELILLIASQQLQARLLAAGRVLSSGHLLDRRRSEAAMTLLLRKRAFGSGASTLIGILVCLVSHSDFKRGEITLFLKPGFAVGSALLREQHVHDLVGAVIAVFDCADGQLDEAARIRIDR